MRRDHDTVALILGTGEGRARCGSCAYNAIRPSFDEAATAMDAHRRTQHAEPREGNMDERPPKTYDEYKERVEAKLAAFRATGLSRYGDGRAEWAEYVAYQQEQHREWLAYEKANYPTLTFAEGQRELAAARAGVRDAEASADANEDRYVAAIHRLEIINYELWNTPFEETDSKVRDHTADLSDPFQSLRDMVNEAEKEVMTFQSQVDAGIYSSPPAVELLNEAQIQLDAARARLASAVGS